jgi:hypothetical protein
MLSNNRIDKWWKATIDYAELDEIGIDFKNRISKEAISFYERFSNIDSIISFLLNKRSPDDKYISPRSEVISLCYAAILQKMFGRVEFINTLQVAYEKSKTTPIFEIVSNLKSRLDLGV